MKHFFSRSSLSPPELHEYRQQGGTPERIEAERLADSTQRQDAARVREAIGRRRSALVFALPLVAVLAAIWCVPWFVTQDGSAHVYNAQLLLELRDPDAPVNEYFRAEWTPLPNLAGHVLLMGLLSLLSPRIADRILISLTFACFACSIGWLRLKVAGAHSSSNGATAGAAALSVLLALNWMWLMGFYSFLLGAMMFALTLGVWWRRREQFGAGAAGIITLMLIAGYFCHIVSFGMTAAGLGVLALATPGAEWRKRCLWTATSFVPLVPLGLLYRGLMKASGEAHPLWRNMSAAWWSPRTWFSRWQAAETLQLSSRKFLPFGTQESAWHALLSPTFLAATALIMLFAATLFAARGGWAITTAATAARRLETTWLRTHRGWLFLALLLLGVWAFGPDDLGERHGMFLRPRVLLLALVVLVPILRFDLKNSRVVRAATGLLVVALLVQVAWVWDYALAANREGTDFARAREFVGRNQRIATILLSGARRDEGGDTSHTISRQATLERFTASPVAHLDALFGIAPMSGVVWNNYESAYYMFPVKFREPSATERALELDKLNGSRSVASPRAAENLLMRRLSLLVRDQDQIDKLVVWGTDAGLDVEIARRFAPEPIFAAGEVRIFARR